MKIKRKSEIRRGGTDRKENSLKINKKKPKIKKFHIFLYNSFYMDFLTCLVQLILYFVKKQYSI